MNKRGFTLIEIMIVVGIIGILASISVPMFNRLYQNVQDMRTETDLKTIETAVTMYVAETGMYPTRMRQLQDYVSIANVVDKYELNPNL